MANQFNRYDRAAPFAGAQAGARSAAYDEGLRSYMLSVYNYKASGVLLNCS